MEREARSGQQEWPLASFFTIVEGTRSKDLGVLTYPERQQAPYTLSQHLSGQCFLSEGVGQQPPISGPLNSPPKEQRWAGLSAGLGQWVFYLPKKVSCGWPDPLS